MTAAVLALDEAGDPLLGHEPPLALRDELDELLSAQDALGVPGIHQRLVDAGQAEAGAADDNRPLGAVVAVVGPVAG